MTSVVLERPALTRRSIDAWGAVFYAALLFCLLACFGILAVLLADVFRDGWPLLADRGTDFLRSDLSSRPAQAGVWQAIKGSLLLAAFVVVLAFPLGIATAVYLEEYASDTRFTRLVRLNIRNLAGVPSVVFGLLGLAVFVELLGTEMSSGGITGGRSLLSGGLTLAVLVLPIVIITASEAVRAVPQALREGGYGLGATRWEVVRRLVLPNAAPGILTGTVLSLARALGETAPLILTGAVVSNFFSSPEGIDETVRGDYTALPVVIFNWARQAKREFKSELAPAAIIVLLAITMLCNAAAVLLRNRYDKDR